MKTITTRNEKATEIARLQEDVSQRHRKWIKSNRSANLADLRQFLQDVAEEFDGFDQDALIADHFAELWHGADYYINEADSLKPEFQVALYLAIDQGKIVLSGGKSGRSPQSIPIPDVTIILDSNFEFSLLPALRDRMKQTLYVPFYSEEELAEIIRRRVQVLGWNVDKDVLPYLASLSKGTPRQALRLLSASYRVSRSGEEKTVSLAHAKRAVAMEGLDEKGLTVQEQSYLRALADGVTRLGVISSKIAMPASTVQRVVEPYLIRSGLIAKDEGRRELTAAGREHVAKILRVSS